MRGVRMQVLNFPIDTNTDEGYYSFVMENARAELERRKISRRTKEGLEVARAEGKILGRPRKLNDDQIAEARQRLELQQDTITGLAAKFNVGRWTLSRALSRRSAFPPTPSIVPQGWDRNREAFPRHPDAESAALRRVSGTARLGRASAPRRARRAYQLPDLPEDTRTLAWRRLCAAQAQCE